MIDCGSTLCWYMSFQRDKEGNTSSKCMYILRQSVVSKGVLSVFVLERGFFVFFSDLGKMFFSSFLVVPVIAQVQLSVQEQLNKTKFYGLRC